MAAEPAFPPAFLEALAENAPCWAALTALERRWRDEAAGDTPIHWAVRTESRIDVGAWLSDARVWAAAQPGALLLFAAGKRPYAETIPFADLHESLYNHITGELILAPAPNARVTRLKLLPVDALQLLAQMHAPPKRKKSSE